MSKAKDIINFLEGKDSRHQAADKAFVDYAFDEEDVIIVDSGRWQSDGPDRLVMKFSYDYEDKTEHGSFVVEFKKGTDKVIDAHPNYN